MQDKTESTVRTVRVELAERSYDIAIGSGLLANAGALIAGIAKSSKCAIVTDSNVANAQLEVLRAGLDGHLETAGTVVLEPGEATKCFSELENVSTRLLEAGIERDDLVIALGGGVIGDLAGFAASILRRGVGFVQVPTSLLAQVDSSVGGKTGINTAQGKNLIGAFHQPKLVIIDTQTLETLPERQFQAGYAEVAKYGLLGDAAFFEWLEQRWRDVFSGGVARAEAIERSCRAKAVIVEEDERETGRRALLNLGHTFGHALEAHAGYSDRLLHGEAIAIGMALAFQYSNETGLCAGQDAQRAIAHLETVGLPTRISEIPGEPPAPERLMELIGQDKKVQAGVPAFILVRGIGQAYVDRTVDPARLNEFLTRKCLEK